VLTACPERLLILGLVLAASCSGCAEPGKPSGLPVKDDFSDCSTGWSMDADEFVSLSCTGGAYRVLIKNPLQPQNARIFFGEGVKSLNVEADATRRAGPRTVGNDEFLVYGVGCWRSQVQGYVFLISPDGAWGIEKITTGASTPTTLAESAAPSAMPGLAKTNRIRGLCVGGGSEPTTLALYVNGKRIAVTRDRAGFDSFPGFGFFVYSSKNGADVRFDNLVARELTETEVGGLGTASQPVQKPVTGATSKHSTSKLCKEDGIRYVGMTAQAAEVCFTLTPDGRGLIESGWSFVRASGCPDHAEGTTHSSYPGTVDASGQFENPDGLTATIRGVTATGAFEDTTICKGKKFKFSARRQP
jgi:hypothetical protein